MPAITPTAVVGVDRSTSSGQALDWAVDEATRRQLSLHLLCAWHSDYAAETVAPVVPDMQKNCRSIVETAAAHARTLKPNSTRTVHAQAASALIAASRHADCVVVGCRGVGALKEALLGSTSMQLAAYASSPVVVVRQPAGHRSAPRRVVVGVDGSHLSAKPMECEPQGGVIKQVRQHRAVGVLHALARDVEAG